MSADLLVSHRARLTRLLRHLERDPQNLVLLADAAAAAVEAQDLEAADNLLQRHRALADLPLPLTNLRGLVALSQRRFDDAADAFDSLRRQGHDAPALRFNLAWSNAMRGAYREALDLLDDDAIAASPQGPALKIQMMHHLDLYEDALACGQELAARYPDNEPLMGALATLALDAEKPDLARSYAEKTSGNSDGHAALGVLTLGEHDSAGALALFEQALAEQPDNPRAWIGKGLAQTMSGQSAAGADSIDRGAALFGDHLGSWIASGWVYFVNGDHAKARERFERALAIDPNFSESHGALAVLALGEGRLEEARRSSEIALRLDRKSFGGALAKSLLLEQGGDARAAQRVRDIALSTPLGPNGQTIAQALVGFSAKPHR